MVGTAFALGGGTTNQTMTTNPTNKIETAARQSTYSLLVRSEEKQRNIFETVIYALFVVCAVVGVLQFVQQPMSVPTHLGNAEPTVALNVCTDGAAVC